MIFQNSSYLKRITFLQLKGSWTTMKNAGVVWKRLPTLRQITASENEVSESAQADNGKRERGQRVSCFKCGRPGHIAKYFRGVKGVTVKRRGLGRTQHLEFSLSPQ